MIMRESFPMSIFDTIISMPEDALNRMGKQHEFI